MIDELPPDDRDAVWQALRWRDLDYFGHVYHGEFLTLLDEARATWLGRGPRCATRRCTSSRTWRSTT